jgi:Xaa-Pro aminopeptidase
LERRRGEPVTLLGNRDIEPRAAEYGIENWQSLEVAIDEEASARFSEAVSVLRRTKDDAELGRMRAAADTSVQGHLAAWRLARPGMTERRLQVELEADFFRNGAARTAYGSIVGTGPNGSVLHFAPTNRELRDGDIVLIDAGAEIDGYASDVTRAFPAGARFRGIQRDVYQLVLETQQAAITGAVPGAEYKALHLGASRQIAQGLVDLGILRGDADTLVERDAHALFFPHGLGHMLGLATHDAGGCLAGRERSDRFGLKYLRTDLPLQPGYVVTIEPGIYFIRALLTDPERRQTYADAVNWDRVDTMLDFGGIRIEDDVLITANGPELLSGALPRALREVEAIREEALEA